MNIYPLQDIPKACFPSVGTPDQMRLKALRNMSERTMGFFLVRHDASNNHTASFLLTGYYAGRWMLGRIRKHKTQAGRYEIVIRRARMCYYRAVDSTEALADELRYMEADSDAEFCDTSGEWISTPDIEFHDLGFVPERVI